MQIKENITGLQHIGLPTQEFLKTVEFYESLGFCEMLRTEVSESHQPVSFLKNGNLIMEVYDCEKTVRETGAIDHIALDVKDIDAAYEAIRQMGMALLEDQIGSLPFWENGIRYFTVVGPNGEKVEFCQRL
jgi:lactoylglutathione lyase